MKPIKLAAYDRKTGAFKYYVTGDMTGHKTVEELLRKMNEHSSKTFKVAK